MTVHGLGGSLFNSRAVSRQLKEERQAISPELKHCRNDSVADLKRACSITFHELERLQPLREKLYWFDICCTKGNGKLCNLRQRLRSLITFFALHKVAAVYMQCAPYATTHDGSAALEPHSFRSVSRFILLFVLNHHGLCLRTTTDRQRL